jgi:tetratricopeptide (TPR) repeat protein
MSGSPPKDAELEAVENARADAASDPAKREHLAEALAVLAQKRQENGNAKEAEDFLAEAIATATEAALPKDVLGSLHMKLATLLDFNQQEAKSVSSYEKAIACYEEMTPPDEDTAARLRNNLAMIFKGIGKFALAEQHYLKALEILENKHGRSSEFTATLFNNLGGLYLTAGFPDQAREIIQDALDVRQELLGPDHPDVAQSYCNLAGAAHELGKNDLAVQHYEAALRILEKNVATEASSYEEVGLDYIALLQAMGDEKKAGSFKKRMEKVLAA